VNGNSLTITFQDGEIGDLDGLGNAVIVDPGGLGDSGGATDVTEPQIQCTAPDGQWHAADVTLACTAADSESGLANAADASFSLSTGVTPGIETDNATTGSRSVCDVAGNCATAGPFGGNRVDKKSPTIAVTSPPSNAAYRVGEVVYAAYACADDGSGLHSCSGPVGSGAAIDTSAPGIKTFTVQATDHVGNQRSTSVTYRVGCSYVTMGVAPATVVAGRDVRISATLRSCSATPETVVLRFTLSAPGRPNGCGAAKTTMFSTPPITLPAGFSRTLSFTHRVPQKACAGEYSVSVATLKGGVTIDSANATLTVVR
jgi:hypothetical protein